MNPGHYLLSPSRIAAIDWRQTFAAIAQQECVSLSTAWQAWRRSGKPRGALTPRTRRAITAEIEAKRKEGA